VVRAGRFSIAALDGARKSYLHSRSYKGTSARLWHNIGGQVEDATQKAGFYDPTSKSLGVAIPINTATAARHPDRQRHPANKLYLNKKNGRSRAGRSAGIAFSENGSPAPASRHAGTTTARGTPLIITTFSNQS